jgi:hypothetical protein
MRLQRSIRVLTAAAATAAIAAPGATAYPVGSARGDAHPQIAATQPNPVPADWEAIGIATGVGITLLAGGVTVSRRRTRRQAPAVQVSPTGRSHTPGRAY